MLSAKSKTLICSMSFISLSGFLYTLVLCLPKKLLFAVVRLSSRLVCTKNEYFTNKPGFAGSGFSRVMINRRQFDRVDTSTFTTRTILPEDLHCAALSVIINYFSR